MSVPMDQIVQQRQQEIDTQAQRATDRSAALGTAEQGNADARNKELAPLEQRISSAEQDLQGMHAPASTPLPEYKPKPIVDAKDYQQLSWSLLGMALIGGAVSKGNWLGVSATLNGALKGYLEGNQAKAQKAMEDYQTQFKSAQAHDEQAQKEFERILQDKSLSINSMLSQLKIAAAKYDRQDIRFAAEQKSIDAIWKQVDASRNSLAQMESRNDNVMAQVKASLEKAKMAGGAGLSDKAKDLQAELTTRGVTLPQGMRSAKTLTSTLNNLTEKYPDKSAAEIVDLIKNGQIDMKVATTETGVLAKREGNIESAIQALNRPGGLYEQLSKAAQAVNFGDSKTLNNWRLAAQGKAVADPAIQTLRNKLEDTQAEVVSVLSRSGQPTESVRKQAADMFPLDGSVPEIEASIKAGREVADAIQAGNEDVLNALKSGKSVKEVASSLQGGQGGKTGGVISLDQYLQSQGH